MSILYHDVPKIAWSIWTSLLIRSSQLPMRRLKVGWDGKKSCSNHLGLTAWLPLNTSTRTPKTTTRAVQKDLLHDCPPTNPSFCGVSNGRPDLLKLVTAGDLLSEICWDHLFAWLLGPQPQTTPCPWDHGYCNAGDLLARNRHPVYIDYVATFNPMYRQLVTAW